MFYIKKYKKGILLLLCLCILGGCAAVVFSPERFRDVTIELGTQQLSARDFLIDPALSGKPRFVTDPSGIDLRQPGSYPLTLKYGWKEETVTLQIVDTTPPAANVRPTYWVTANELPEAESLVSDIQDYSDVTVSFRSEPVIPLNYQPLSVGIVLEDAWGNVLEKECKLCFRWLKEAYTLELGQELTKETLLYNPQRDSALLDQIQLNKIKASGIGSYVITSRLGDQNQSCVLTVQDTKGPELVLKEVQTSTVWMVKMENFIESVSDASGVADVRMLTEINIREKGKFPVVIEAEDNLGNVTRAETTLWVADDFDPPRIQGSMEDILVEKNGTLPDLLEGITAKDIMLGVVPVECDTSGLDLSRGGTQYVIYRASDLSGNTVEKKRKVIVAHDESDTQALVQDIAAQLEDDVAEIRKYVQYTIGYNHEYGGDDPVWFGFTERRGNCYVHMMCMKAILDIKGIENKIVWTTDESHYWLMVKVDNEWKHSDPTPTRITTQPLMSDTQRRNTLSGRTWDMDKWPVCN